MIRIQCAHRNHINRIGHQIEDLLNVIRQVETTDPTEAIVLDFTHIRFFLPFFMGSLSSFVDHQRAIGRQISMEFPDGNIGKYCGLTRFNNSLFTIGNTEDWDTILSDYNGKNYIPHIGFPTGPGGDSPTKRERVLNSINSLLKTQLNYTNPQIGTISYIISEISDNIAEHAQTPKGYLFGQYFPRTEGIQI